MDIENRLMAAKVGGERVEWSRLDLKFGVSRCKPLHLEWISNKILLYSTGNYIQSFVMEHDGRYYEKKNVYICITGSLCYIAEIDRISVKIKNF